MTRSSDTTRRTFLSTTAAALAASATAAIPAYAGALGADPIFAAIEVHKAAMAALIKVIDDSCPLETSLPLKQRQSFIGYGEATIVETDDPRWIKNTRDYQPASDAETDAAIALVSIVPTTIAGATALLQYATAADTDGHCWPDALQSDDGKKIRTWQFFLIEMLADVLPRLAGETAA